MKVLIVSDTHGQDENLEETVLREAPFDYLIHCGDVEGREIFIEALAECPCTIVAKKSPCAKARYLLFCGKMDTNATKARLRPGIFPISMIRKHIKK